MSTTPGIPNVFVSPDLVGRQSWAPFSSVEIDATGAGDLLRSWQMPDYAIERVYIVASPDKPDRLFTISGTTTSIPTYSRTVTGRVAVYMGNVHNAISYPSEYWTSDQQKRARDASGHLVDALSYARDEAVMGKVALVQEREQAETDVIVKKALPRALGALATGALLGIGAYLNHKYNVLTPEIAVDIVGAVGTAAASMLAWKGSRAAIQKEAHKRTALKQWPADLRAQARVGKYRNDRDNGLRPELVTYQVTT